MKKLTYKEFTDRTIEVTKARKIFMPHITNNITIAFGLYQEILAEEERDVMISTLQGGNARPGLFDKKTPECPECHKPMRLKIGTEDDQKKHWPTSWWCPICLLEFYSEKTPQEWLAELESEESDSGQPVQEQ